MRAVENPGNFIKSYLNEKPSGLRHLLREMQGRKRVNVGPVSKQDKINLMKEVSPSAFERFTRRQQGDRNNVSLEQETLEEKEIKKIMRLTE